MRGSKALVLGGTAFMGRHVVATLSERGMLVTTLNRGREYWGGCDDVGHASHSHVKADRRCRDSWQRGIRKAAELAGHFELIVDFCACDPALRLAACFETFPVQPALRGPNKKSRANAR
jgi:nucleoside-diphosphate-sugar epimerase